MLAQICNHVGLPKGVFNVVHGLGSDVGEALVTHKNVKAVTFTGSTATGEQIAKNTALILKKYRLRWGQKPQYHFRRLRLSKSTNNNGQ
ncbi:MAG: aldehyde dehydrogenase family protein [Bdellovibrionales bacterium]